MTAREIFDKVRAHLLQQGRQAMNGCGTFCVYRASDGSKCAVGCLIPDPLYQGWFESAGVRDLPGHILKEILPSDLSRDDGLNFLAGLQRIHDSCLPISWPFQFDQFASEHFDES